MANQLLKDGVNPIKLDTAGAASAITDALIITSIVWDSGDSGAAGDNLVIHDADGGNVVFQATLGTAKDTVIWSPSLPLRVDGLYLTTLDRGTVLVYVE